jgi:uncharacterized protein YjiS (DUF1127 family)
MSCSSTTCASKSIETGNPARLPFGLAWPVPNPFAVLAKAGRMHERWRQRQCLLELDDRLLPDIGISRREVREQARKPFWK